MAYPNVFDAVRIPTDVLVALDWRPYRFAAQPYHHVIRLAHIVSMAMFFGAITVIDLCLIGWRPALSLKPMLGPLRPWLYLTFAVAILTGCALFFYDPVHVASHAYFAPKLILTVLGVANALYFRHVGELAIPGDTTVNAETDNVQARIVGAVSLAIWVSVVVCACLNVEAAPRVLLR
jgi:hypothetical protein